MSWTEAPPHGGARTQAKEFEVETRQTWFACAATTFLLCACGGGSDSNGPGQPLSVPSQMTVVGAQDQQTGNLRLIPDRYVGQPPPRSQGGGTAAATTTDYQADQTRIWVNDESLGPMQIINEILCMLDQTGYSDPTVLNAGPYVVLVNESRCQQQGSDPSNGGQSTEGTSTTYQEWTVRSSRTDDGSPHEVSFWIDWEEDFGDEPIPARLYGLLTIYESPSDAAPYGRFVLHFKLLPRAADPTSSNVIFKGSLSTVARDDGLAEYTFRNSMGNVEVAPQPGQQSMLEQARVVTDGTTGRAFTMRRQRWNRDNGPQEEGSAYHLAYNAGFVVRKKVAGNDEVKAFDRTSFETFPWRYGLYDNTSEARVNRNSGFGIRTQGGDYGFAGYHGLWFPDHVQVTTGMTVVRPSHENGGSSQTYTVFVAPGRLEKRTRTSSTLGNLKNEDMHSWDNQAQRPIMVRWTGTDLVKVSAFDQQSQRWQEINPPVSILGQYQPGWWVGFNSPARGEINIVWPNGNPTDATPVSIWSVTPVTADSAELANGDLPLYGYFQMLRSNITQNQANWQNNESPYFPDATNVNEGKVYSFAKASLVLQLAGQPVTLANGVTIEGRNGGGLHSGPLLGAALNNLGEIQNQTVNYRWQIGTQSWNQLRALRDANNAFVAFDPPLEFSYTHNDPQNVRFHNKVFRLEYQGHGQLHGIPHEEAGNTGRWYPVFGIPTGTVLTNNAGIYKVKVLEAEQRMTEIQNAQQVIQSQGFDLDNTLTPPADAWRDPAIGTKPSVTGAPRYIDGVRQS